MSTIPATEALAAPDRPRRNPFKLGNHISPAGRTPHRHMADEDLDLVLHLGDYVYEGGIPADGGYRQVPTPEVLRTAPRDVERWRMQYALYKSDPDLRAAHARFPWAVTRDDHEVQNDYANTRSQYEGDISALRAAAYQAWYEHQPVRAPARPGPAGPRIYRRLK